MPPFRFKFNGGARCNTPFILLDQIMNEKDLLQRLHDISHRTGFKNTGDDAAVLGDLVLSTDQFVEGTHFTWQQMPPENVGYKGAVQAFSDLAAMASRPLGLLCSASWPRTETERILAVFAGIERACTEYNIPLIGGDVSSARTQTYLDFTVIGKNSAPPRLTNIKSGQRLAVTGPLGSAQGGLYSLQNQKNYPALIEAFRAPRAHIATALALHEAGVVGGITDISDSLSKSLYLFKHHSGCGARIDFKKIPTHSELRSLCASEKLDVKDFVFGGGEDYQLLMTLTESASEKLISDYGLCVIGDVILEPKVIYIEDKKEFELTEVGWDPFVL